MTRQQKADFLRQALGRFKGDDLERAESAFRRETPQSLQKKYGHSGSTKQQVLDEYRKFRQQWIEAKEYLEELLKRDA